MVSNFLKSCTHCSVYTLCMLKLFLVHLGLEFTLVVNEGFEAMEYQPIFKKRGKDAGFPILWPAVSPKSKCKSDREPKDVCSTKRNHVLFEQLSHRFMQSNPEVRFPFISVHILRQIRAIPIQHGILKRRISTKPKRLVAGLVRKSRCLLETIWGPFFWATK